MTPTYFAWAFLFVVILCLEWCLTLVSLPGNWLMVLTMAGFTYLFPAAAGAGIGWTAVGVAAGLALVGEVIEFASGAAGMAKGGSKRGALLAMVGSLIGGITGASLGSAVPILGTLVVGLLFAATGAMVGAYVGEIWVGKTEGQSLEIGKAAFWGRLVGSAGKILMGSLILALAAIAAFF